MSSLSVFHPIEEHLRRREHICAFYESKTEQFQIIIPFLAGGLLKHERCLLIAGENTAAEIKAGLLLHDLDIDRYLNSGQLSVITTRGFRACSGRFDPQEMLLFLSSAVNEAMGEGYSGLRVAVEESWILRDLSSLDDHMWYEAMANAAFRNLPLKTLCQYNAKRFLGDVVLKVLKTHPRVLLGLNLYENQFYEPLIPTGRRAEPPEDYEMLSAD